MVIFTFLTNKSVTILTIVDFSLLQHHHYCNEFKINSTFFNRYFSHNQLILKCNGVREIIAQENSKLHTTIHFLF